jgi:hypothetical protein
MIFSYHGGGLAAGVVDPSLDVSGVGGRIDRRQGTLNQHTMSEK